MNAALARWLAETVFHTSSGYRMELYDRLEESERRSLEQLRRSPDFYGILRPVSAESVTFKAIDRETALLLFTLREAGRLPSYLLESEQASQHLKKVTALVLDGVLEIKSGDRFVSGPEAQSLFSDDVEDNSSLGQLVQLAHDALRYAQALKLDDIEQLAGRLYGFNQLPLTSRWQHLFRDAESITQHVGLGHAGTHRSQLLAWARPVPRREAAGWLAWQRRGEELNTNKPVYKLYVSPMPGALDQAVGGLLDSLASIRASGFKLGANAAALLRPDKLIVYFKDFDRLSQACETFSRRLEGIPAQGVPFTAEVAGDGLLSWGLDPPESDRLAVWQPRESWRLWVARRLAAALATAQRQTPAATPPWRFALERLRLAGVDVERWTADPALWPSAAGS